MINSKQRATKVINFLCVRANAPKKQQTRLTKNAKKNVNVMKWPFSVLSQATGREAQTEPVKRQNAAAALWLHQYKRKCTHTQYTECGFWLC